MLDENVFNKRTRCGHCIANGVHDQRTTDAFARAGHHSLFQLSARAVA
jgi:hypothetical protein